jgi:hypothetical protein
MSFDTYANLQTEIANYLHRTDLTSKIPGFITLAESDISKKLRIWQLESLETLSVTQADPEVTLPSRVKDVKWVKLSGTYERLLRRMQAAAFYRLYGQQGEATAQTGSPIHYFFEEDKIIVGPSPSDDYTLTALCIRMNEALSASNTTNTVLTNYPDVYFYGSLVHAFRYTRHVQRMQEAQAAFEQAVEEANRESRKLRASGIQAGIRSIGRRRIV